MTAAGNGHGPAFFVKDVLRIGRFRVGSLDLVITSQILNRLVANFRLAKARGVRVPVVWNHSTDARDVVGWIDDLFVRDGELFARFAAALPADVARIGRANRETSVELVHDFVDGLGRRYSPMLAHLGIVQYPVVPQQRDFVRLAGETPAPQWSRQVTRPASHSFRLSIAQGEPTPMTESTSASPANVPQSLRLAGIAKVIATINRILKAMDSLILLPEDTAPEELPERVAHIMKQLLPPNPEPSESAAAAPTAPEPVDAELAQLRLQLADSQRQLESERQANREEKARLYAGSIDRMIATGRLTPADRDDLLAAGRSASFSLSLLAPFERLPAGAFFGVQPVARRHADAREPSLDPRSPMSTERAAELARSFAD